MEKYTPYDLKKLTKTLYDIQDLRKRIEGRLGIKANGEEKKIKYPKTITTLTGVGWRD